MKRFCGIACRKCSKSYEVVATGGLACNHDLADRVHLIGKVLSYK
jgi:hypothetical protein